MRIHKVLSFSYCGSVLSESRGVEGLVDIPPRFVTAQFSLLSGFYQINDGIRHLLWFVLLQKVTAFFDGVVG